MRKCANCYFFSTNAFFCSTNYIFLVCITNFFGGQEKKNNCAVQTFAVSLPPFGISFCCLMGQVLTPFASFAVFCHLMLNF